MELLASWQPHNAVENALLTVQQFMLRSLLAVVLTGTGDLDGARATLRTMLEASQAMPHLSDMRLRVVETYDALADIMRQQGKLDEAERMNREGLQLAEQYEAATPNEQRWHLEVIRHRETLGQILFEKNDAASMIEALRPAIALIDRLEAAEPVRDEWAQKIRNIYMLSSVALLNQDNFSEAALRIHGRALTYFQELDPSPLEIANWGWLLVRKTFFGALNVLLEAGNATGVDAEVLNAANRAIDLSERLPVQNEHHARVKRSIEELCSLIKDRATPPSDGTA
jgi:tetratricopeptide (TPR) repeat protein